MPPIPSSTTRSAPKEGAKDVAHEGATSGAPKLAPEDVTREGAPTDDERVHAYERKDKSLFMRFLDRFGTNQPQSAAERESDLAYRAARKAAFDAELPKLVASDAPFDDVLRQAHRLLNEEKHFPLTLRISAVFLGNTLDAGAYRTGPNRAGDYRAPSAHDVPQLMKDFGGAVARMLPAKDDADALRIAAWALTVMIRIHPFADGNGRTARAAMNLALGKSGQKMIDFPSDSEGVYKKSPVWARLKDHMKGFVTELGWTMKDGMIPPPGYAKKLAGMLTAEITSTSIDALRGRPDIQAIADALAHARTHGFGG